MAERCRTSPRVSARRARRRLVTVLVTVVSMTAATMALAAPSQASSLLQPAGVTVAVDGGVAYVATATTVAFTVTNKATNGASLAAFTLVVPKGVGTVRPVGVTGPGNWREVVASCGAIKTCSSLVLVYGAAPLSTSKAKPGQSVTASIMFTTPVTPGPLAFGMIGLGGGLFTTTDHPTVNVVTGTAAHFLVSAPATLTAGTPAAVTVQAVDGGFAPTPYAGGTVQVQLGTDDAGATIVPTSYPGPTSSFSGTPSRVALTLPASASGAYSFTSVLTVAGPQSVTVTETRPAPDATGTAGLVVVPGPAAHIFFDSITDASASPPLPNPTAGQLFVAQFHVTDVYNNMAATAPGDVALSASGPGSLTAISATPATPTTGGSFTDSYGTPALSVLMTVTLTTVSPTVSATLTTRVDANAAAATFTPGTPGVLGTTNFAPPNPDGSSNCPLSDTNPVCGQTILPNGANGRVVISEQPCTDSSGECAPTQENGGKPLVLSISGNFKDANGNALYTYEAPATEVVTCESAQCPALADDGDGSLANSPEEAIEDFDSFPLFIQLTQTDGYAQVPSCQAIPSDPANLVSADTIPQGNTVGACVDVASIVRNVDVESPHYGDVSFTVLFVDDPKTHP